MDPVIFLIPRKKRTSADITASTDMRTKPSPFQTHSKTVEGLTPKRAARFLAEEPLSDGEARVVALEESCPG